MKTPTSKSPTYFLFLDAQGQLSTIALPADTTEATAPEAARKFLFAHGEEYLKDPLTQYEREHALSGVEVIKVLHNFDMKKLREQYRAYRQSPTPAELVEALRSLVEHEEQRRDVDDSGPLEPLWEDTSAARELLDRYDALHPRKDPV